MKIGLLQLNSTIGDFAANQKKLLAGYEKAVALGAEFILAPELFLCGYPPRDLLQRPDFIDANLSTLNETAKNTGAIPLCVGYVDRSSEKPGRALRNSAAVLQNGKIIWCTHKSLLPTTTFLTKTVILNRPKKLGCLNSMAKKSASRFAKTSGMMKISGRNDCIAAIRSKN